MRSGTANQTDNNTLSIMHNVVALVKTLMEDAIKSAEKFVMSCGRTHIKDKDITMALKYETHEFLLQGESLESKFAVNLEEEKQHTYETDDEEEEDEEDSEEDGEEGEEEEGEEEGKEEGEEEGEEEDNEEYSTTLKSDDAELIEIHRKFLKYHEEWDEWEPTDQLSTFMKSTVNKTSSQCGVF